MPSVSRGCWAGVIVSGKPVMVNTGAEGNRTIIEYVELTVARLLSTTCTAKVKVPLAVGVPDRIPVWLNEIPAGKAPDANDHV